MSFAIAHVIYYNYEFKFKFQSTYFMVDYTTKRETTQQELQVRNSRLNQKGY